MVVWTVLPADKASSPEKLELGVGTLDAVLVAIAAHLSAGRLMSKERVNLEALQEHCGTAYTQTLAVPEPLFESLRAVYGIVPFVLLPPLDDEDAVVLLADWHGALKGLPPNERANLLCQAAGTPYKVRGDVFLGRVRLEGGGAPVPGDDVLPTMITEREWLEAAQSANKVGAGKDEAQELGSLLGAYAAAAVAQVQQQAGADTQLSSGAPVAIPAAEADPCQVDEGDDSMGVLKFQDNSTEGDTAPSVTATVRVPATTKAHHVQCEVSAGRLLLRVETLGAGHETVVDAELFQPVDDHSWALEDDTGARLLTLELDKTPGVAGHVRWLSLTR
eukprot:COSAG02_NODE_11671_length_1676_cov_2.388079_1_plen_333_part_00